MRKVTIGCIFLCFLFLVGCSNKNDENTSTINTPDKIIVYKDGNQEEIEKSNPNFNKIAELTNDRIDKKNISVTKDGVDIDKFVKESMKNNLGIEFVYDEEQKMDISNNEGFQPINYYRLYFNIKSDKAYESECFQYGDKDAYVDSSRGPLKPSEDILNIVE
ncbi:hypothetical protein [Clostridium intestinale]|uniref:hypothetical protein n=1 Tax=Clostridium intestinale TaxID=36845 RepID=UPI0028EEC980|nr:hypothetical protein [Clostridium intestinale]